jgi:very-short-patch-repair endonuclease
MHHSFQSSKPSSLIVERARQMRCALTLSEQTLWSGIAGRRLGVTFRRQVPLGRFIADFAAPAAGLVVEWYGSQCTPR